MKTTYFQIQAISPIAIGGRQTYGQSQSGLTYIPGTVLRGALANLMLKEEELDRPGDKFKSIFLSENAAIFRNAYILRSEGGIPLIVPNSVVTAKNNSDFRLDSRNAFDSLIDQFCTSKLSLDFLPPVLSERVESLETPYYSVNEKGVYSSVAVDTRFVSGINVNRQRNRAEINQSYLTHVISEYQLNGKRSTPTQFLTSLSCAEDLTEYFQELKYVGADSTRGLGHIRVEAIQTPKTSSLSDRVNQFNKKLSQRWDTYATLCPSTAPERNGTYFTIDLQANAIFKTTDKSPTINPERELKQLFNETPLTVEWIQAQYDHQGGWNSAWRLPRPTEVVTKMGSCYLCHTSEKLDKIISILENMEIYGLGERTAEGFGQVRICDELHTILL